MTQSNCGWIRYTWLDRVKMVTYVAYKLFTIELVCCVCQLP